MRQRFAERILPVRRIPPKHRGLTGVVNRRNHAPVAYESAIERDFIILMMGETDFISIEDQPVSISVSGASGRAGRYIPDFLVHFSKRTSKLVEVKPSDVLAAEHARFVSRFDAARRYAYDRDWRFEIWTEQDIRGVRLENLKFLRRFDHAAPSSSLAARAFAALQASGGAATVAALATDVGDEEATWAIWRLIAIGRLSVNLDEPLTPSSMVCGPQGDAVGLAYAV